MLQRILLILGIAVATAQAQTTAPTTHPAVVALIKPIEDAFAKADAEFTERLNVAQRMLVLRMNQAQQNNKEDPDLLREQTRKWTAILREPVKPEIGQHDFPENAENPLADLRPASSRAAVRMYKSDIELGRKSWIKQIAPFSDVTRVLKEEEIRAGRKGMTDFAARIQSMRERIELAATAPVTRFEREPNRPEKQMRRNPVSLRLEKVKLKKPEPNALLTGEADIRNFDAFQSPPNGNGVGMAIIVVHEGKLVYNSISKIADEMPKDQTITIQFQSRLKAANGADRNFRFFEPGNYVVRLILVGVKTDDVYDAHEETLELVRQDQQPIDPLLPKEQPAKE